MSVTLDKMVIVWNETEDSPRKVSQIEIIPVGQQSSAYIRKYMKSDGANGANWPERAPHVLGYILSKGFASEDIERDFISALTQISNIPAWFGEFISGWISAKLWLWDNDENESDVARFTATYHKSIFS
jgi:hypothetical protein